MQMRWWFGPTLKSYNNTGNEPQKIKPGDHSWDLRKNSLFPAALPHTTSTKKEKNQKKL